MYYPLVLNISVDIVFRINGTYIYIYLYVVNEKKHFLLSVDDLKLFY